MTPEQTALSKKAKESLSAAQLLHDNGMYDFAVSRAYYAMFYVAEALLLGEGKTFSKHSGVIAAFGQQFVKTGQVAADFHRYLIEGQASRNISDYDASSSLTKEQSEEQIRRAKAFIEMGERTMGQESEAPPEES